MRTSFGILLVMFMALGCANIRTEWQVKEDVDWSAKKTFSFAPEKPGNEGGAAPAPSHDLVRSLIQEGLVAKGYTEVEEQPDFLVYFFVGEVNRDTTRYDRASERLGEIDIHMSEVGASEWLWHGWATKTLTRRIDREEEVRKAVPIILEKFPNAS